ncbi:glycogen/starch/alpha-glucan phosphorylase [Methylobacter sp. S3L5C]|uniref:glycogen/starch/alpha-glucan phosphorylase n=1 Tax=Methylobacter sp. S3L5C TaxID=2839024 RepID=UPI001FAB7AAA|nr:glycogen/starch/alpha-glucan phosphorylase [Methylobacter sp. S3L5C]UOA09812.1 glycogen/starch/alpha-glucan phosphorylase [Methylobacter sp. S3L5C]
MTTNNKKTGHTLNDKAIPVDEDIRTSLSTAALKKAILDHLIYSLGKLPEIATEHSYYKALALTVRDRLQHLWGHSVQTYFTGASTEKVACYFSAEFLMGPQLGSSLVNLGIEFEIRQAVAELGKDLDDLMALEEEPGLGNGGLGRLAACYLDSLATLERPAIGYGIRYEFGIFDQEIHDGWQVEITDKWLRWGNPWEIAKPDVAYYVNLGGQSESYHDHQGSLRKRWIPHHVVKGVAFDTPVPGYRVNTCNTLRLWSAEACESFDFQAFNTGDYYQAVDDKVISETLTKVLYPNDEPEDGKKLRLAQQYFFVSCSLQDMLNMLELAGLPLEHFPDRFAAQLNDTHPSVAIAELMRILVDERQLAWDSAWSITFRTFGYTNHTLLPEALETWSLPLFGELLPRHLEIIYEINSRFLDEVRRRYPGDDQRVARLSLIDEGGKKRIRMAHLACVGSHAINGVAALHSELLTTSLLKDFYELWPERFSNKTNGVTPRRFMVLANPKLSDLITRSIGDGWITQTNELKKLEAFAEDAVFRQEWRAVKQANKEKLATYLHKQTGIELNPTWLFDIQVKRIHEYKRQHLNVLHIITLYCRLKRNPSLSISPQAFIFGGKAAPGYFLAKRIIKLINAVAEVINNDSDVNKYLRVAFIPNFNVQNGQLIYPAADLSEQISTAGKEASGTGNMKFTLNGALTIGTLDGANIEIREEVGAENFFLFGLTEKEAVKLQCAGYHPATTIEKNPQLAEVIHLIASGHFSHGDTEIFRPLIDNLCQNDPFLVLADYADYIACQDKVTEAWQDPERWTRMSILNTARAGKFSSDRAIREYCDEIWNVRKVSIKLPINEPGFLI